MENDELENKENANKFDPEQEQPSEKIEPVQEFSEDPAIEADSEQNDENSFVETDKNSPEDPATEDEKLVESPMDESTEPITSPQEKEVKKMPAWLRNSLIFVGVGILLLLAGYLLSYYTATLPAQNSYATALHDLKNKDNELNDLQKKFDQVNSDLAEAKSDLTEAKSDLGRVQQDYQALDTQYNQLLANSEFNQNLIDFKYEVSRAKFALLNNDRTSANLSISLAKDKFKKIQILLGSDISTGMNDQLQEIQKLIRTNPDKALDELRTLNENLERIPFK